MRIPPANLAAFGAFGVVALAAFPALALRAMPPAPRIQVTAPAGGGIPDLEVVVREGNVTYRTCVAHPCVAPAKALAIPEPSVGKSEARSLAIGAGKHAVHVRVFFDRGRTWEALIVGNDVVFADNTGWQSGSEGERTGRSLTFVAGDGGVETPVLADVREDTLVCGQGPALLHPQGLDPKSLIFRGATLQRISKVERAAAKAIVAKRLDAADEPALARLLAPAGSTSERPAAFAVDRDPRTAWTETRPGDGHGELVTLRAPREVPIVRLRVTPSPSVRLGSFFVKTSDRTFMVSVPTATAAGGDSAPFEIAFEAPVKTPCLSIVLGEATGSKPGADPEVGFAEIEAFSEYDAKDTGLGRAVSDLALGGDRADAAASVLARAGKAGISALAKGAFTLDAAARLRALEAASGAPCEDSVPLFARLLDDADKAVRDRARGRVERCGKSGSSALTAALLDESPKVRASSAAMLALVAPSLARAELPKHLGAREQAERRAVRAALAKALARASVEDLAKVLAAPLADDRIESEIDLLRAFGERATDVAAAILPRVRAALSRATRPEGWPVRYALTDVLAVVAAKDASAEDELGRILSSDAHLAVRTHAAELAHGKRLGAALAKAADDPEPRVRTAALASLGAADPGRVFDVAAARLDEEREPWTFVRVAATESLGSVPGDGGRVVPALSRALKDASPRVREAAINAFAKRRDPAAIDAITARLKDEEERAEVRRAAATALGATCAKSSSNVLTELASRGASPVATEDDRNLGLAATAALGKLHPNDLSSRLEPLLREGASPLVKRAARAALSETTPCR